MKAIVVVFSGGQDSTTCLYWAKAQFPEADIHALTFDYGQRHRIEIEAARRIADYADIYRHEVVELGQDVLYGTSPLVSGKELEQYDDHQSLPGGLEKTFVPMRNQLFLTIAANRAYVLDTNMIVTGVSAEDYGGYPDCRPKFIESFERTSRLGTFTGEGEAPLNLYVATPLMGLTKAQTVRLALEYDGCYEALALSHTSYDGQYPPKGKDHATLLRAKGFEEAGVPDPLVLRAVMEGKMLLPTTPNYGADATSGFDQRVLNIMGWLKSYV